MNVGDSLVHRSEGADYAPINDYAFIGDCRSAGLISRDGSLGWLCPPRFDGPSIFAAVLDAENGGRFLVRPIGGFRTERRYLADTNVLETVFRAPGGSYVLCDLMSVSSEEEKQAYLSPEHEVLRELEGLEGEVEVLYDPRPGCDQSRGRLEVRGREIEAHGYNERMGSYTRTFDGEQMDASLLTLPLYGYIGGTHPRMRSTCARIHEKPALNELVYRYEAHTDDGLPPGEGAFGICSFWAVECVARGGNLKAATRSFERLLSYANDVGLFAEEIDPESGAALGNFPQAFTHIGLINAALTIGEYQAGDEEPAESHSNDIQDIQKEDL